MKLQTIFPVKQHKKGQCLTCDIYVRLVRYGIGCTRSLCPMLNCVKLFPRPFRYSTSIMQIINIISKFHHLPALFLIFSLFYRASNKLLWILRCISVIPLRQVSFKLMRQPSNATAAQDTNKIIGNEHFSIFLVMDG